jgi:hypothetical protein
MRVPNGTFMQMAWVVNDIEAAMRRWHEQAGVGPFFYGPRTRLDIVHRGKPSVFDFNGALAQAGPIQIELLCQHDDAPTAFREVFKPGQEGPHHMGTIVQDYDAEFESYRRQGFDLVHTGQVQGRRFCYFDTRPSFGLMTELLEDAPGLREMFGKVADASVGWDGNDPYRDRSRW